MKNKTLISPSFVIATLASLVTISAFAESYDSSVDLKPDAVMKQSVDPKALVDNHFRAVIAPEHGESFIWVEAIDGGPAIGEGLIFRNCNVDGLNLRGEGGMAQKLTQDTVDEGLESTTDQLLDKHIKINPRKCKPAYGTDQDVFPMRDVIHESTGVKRIFITIGRAVAEGSLLVVSNISSNTFTWAKPIEWGAATVAAKSFMSLLSDKPLGELADEARIAGAARDTVKYYKDKYMKDPDGSFITVRVTDIDYPKLLQGLQSELDSINHKYCGHNQEEKHPDGVCHQWKINYRERMKLLLDPEGTIAKPIPLKDGIQPATEEESEKTPAAQPEAGPQINLNVPN